MTTNNANATESTKSAIQDPWDSGLLGDANVNPVSLIADHCSITEVQVWATATLIRPSSTREALGPALSQRPTSSNSSPRSIGGGLLICSQAARSMALRSVGVVAMTMIQGPDFWKQSYGVSGRILSKPFYPCSVDRMKLDVDDRSRLRFYRIRNFAIAPSMRK